MVLYAFITLSDYYVLYKDLTFKLNVKNSTKFNKVYKFKTPATLIYNKI